jgi:hypothetical protein
MGRRVLRGNAGIGKKCRHSGGTIATSRCLNGQMHFRKRQKGPPAGGAEGVFSNVSPPGWGPGASGHCWGRPPDRESGGSIVPVPRYRGNCPFRPKMRIAGRSAASARSIPTSMALQRRRGAYPRRRAPAPALKHSEWPRMSAVIVLSHKEKALAHPLTRPRPAAALPAASLPGPLRTHH